MKLLQKRQRYFHRKQLRPFAALINGELRGYFDELETEVHAEGVTDDSYLLYGMEHWWHSPL